MDIHIPLEKLQLDDFPHRLVGKFFTNSTPLSLEETESSLREQWPQILAGNMTIHTQNNDRIILLNFKQKKDKEFVLSEGAWVVNKVMLVIKELTSDEIDFTVTNLCVTVVGLPLFYHYSTKVLSHIKTLLSHGNIKATLIYRTKLYIYFQAVTDLKKPLKAGFFISENRYVEFKYKNIGDFCYNCGIIGHVKSNCDQEFPKERVLNATSKTSVYGPWLRLYIIPNLFEMVLKSCDEEKEEDLKECEKTLLYPQFYVKIKFNEVAVCNSESSIFTSSNHRFRFPCSYLNSSDLSNSKAGEVIENEIDENTALFFKDMNREKSNLICSVLENMNVIRKNSEDKWIPLKIEINKRYRLQPVTYETILAGRDDLHCVEEIEKKMSELVKKKVEEQYHLDCVSLWEVDIRDALADIGYFDYPYLFDVTSRAEQAIREASEMMFSSITRPIPAKRGAVEKLERKKVIGSEIDRLDSCVICSQEMFLGEEVTVLPCSHVFHSLCS